MNIIQAANGGKRFKRKGWNQNAWLSFDEAGGLRDDDKDQPYIEKEDLTCDDWEIEEERIEITRSQFIDKVNAHFAKEMSSRGLVMLSPTTEELVFNSIVRYWAALKNSQE